MVPYGKLITELDSCSRSGTPEELNLINGLFSTKKVENEIDQEPVIKEHETKVSQETVIPTVQNCSRTAGQIVKFLAVAWVLFIFFGNEYTMIFLNKMIGNKLVTLMVLSVLFLIFIGVTYGYI